MILKLFGAKIQRHFINSVEMYFLNFYTTFVKSKNFPFAF